MSAVGLGSKMRQMLEPTEAPFEHGFTNSGHPVGAAVALANIAVLENQELVQHVRATLGPQLQAGLRKIRRQQGVADVRSMGIIGAIELEADGLSAQQMDDLGHAVTAAALRRAVICRAVGPSIVFVLPMIITEKQLTQVLDVLSASIDEVLGGRKPEQTDDRSLL
jgi:adenosylmethionine-8-amino-7-oxononanoate aminotransferase